MQNEFDAMSDLALGIKIIGLNEIGRSTNDSFVEGRDVPWLQDNSEQNVWERWGIRYRDLLLVDAENRAVAVFNLTATNLGTDDYEVVKAEFLDLAKAN